MLGRLSYVLRETWASFRRNMTLTIAAIITSAVALLIFGLTRSSSAASTTWCRLGGRRRGHRVRQPEQAQRRHEQRAGTRRRREIIQSNLDASRSSTTTRTATPCARSTSPTTLYAGDPTTLRLLTADPDRAPDLVQDRSDRGRRTRPTSRASAQRSASCRRCSSRRVRGRHHRGRLEGQELRRALHADPVDPAAARRDPADLEHDPDRDVRPTARDRGDEARRRHRLVHPRPVHARGAGPGIRRRARRVRRAVVDQQPLDRRRARRSRATAASPRW